MQISLVDPNLITINREKRQRRELTNIEELAESIEKVGLLNPIIVDENLELIAGERRLTAVLYLGLTEIYVRYITDLSLLEKHLIELEENVKRVDLPWQDHVRAVEEYHRLKAEADPKWTQDQTAAALGVAPQTVSKYLTVASNMENKLVSEADKFSTALNAAQRAAERKATAVKADLNVAVDKMLDIVAPETEPRPILRQKAAIIHTPFSTWLKSYDGPQFNFIHCDFPYGVNVGDKSGQSAAKITGHYDDSPEIYRALLGDLARFMPHVAPSAHLFFWFSMDFYAETVLALREMGWKVLSRPLIWHKSDNAGILPDPNRGPRWTYETALFASRGDRKVVKAVAASFSGPTSRDLHTSEKPRPMLEHFFRMFVDETTRLLDPTCGSGNAVRVGKEMGADFSLGLEINPEFAESARLNVEKAQQPD